MAECLIKRFISRESVCKRRRVGWCWKLSISHGVSFGWNIPSVATDRFYNLEHQRAERGVLFQNGGRLKNVCKCGPIRGNNSGGGFAAMFECRYLGQKPWRLFMRSFPSNSSRKMILVTRIRNRTSNHVWVLGCKKWMRSCHTKADKQANGVQQMFRLLLCFSGLVNAAGAPPAKR